MRLIDVETKRFAVNVEQRVQQKGKKDVEYGILSHRWGKDEEEVSFQDIQSAEIPRQKEGYYKIEQCCEQARLDGLDYIWVDTCCINKSSSAELQESINSMYGWYRKARICYAYLKDTELEHIRSSPQSIEDSEWFTRGWTLQELVAPKDVRFYDKRWHRIGDKISLKYNIQAATGIDITLLEGKSKLEEYSVAERMSWASRRDTKILEDRAYCLFGIFQVNLPMLYGEGSRAFLRLQEEIIKNSDDHSIFAWRGISDKNPGLLASTPDAFRYSGAVKSVRVRKGKTAYTMTNRGIAITLNLTPWTTDTYVASLHCTNPTEENNSNKLMQIFLRRLDEDDQYARVKVDGEEFVGDATARTDQQKPITSNVQHWRGSQRPELWSRDLSIHVRQAALLGDQKHYSLERAYGFRICNELIKHNSRGISLFEVFGQWNETERTLTAKPGTATYGTIGLLDLTDQKKKIKMIKFGLDLDFNPVCFLAESSAIDTKVKVLNKTGSWNFNSEWQFNQEDMNMLKSLWERSSNDPVGWNKIREIGGRKNALLHHLRPGLWALKGDRVDGLDIFLSLGTPTRVTLKKIEVSGRLIWDFEVKDLPSSSWFK